MQQAGDTMINFQPLAGLPNFFRLVFPSASSITEDDLDALLLRIDNYGQQISTAEQ